MSHDCDIGDAIVNLNLDYHICNVKQCDLFKVFNEKLLKKVLNICVTKADGDDKNILPKIDHVLFCQNYKVCAH